MMTSLPPLEKPRCDFSLISIHTTMVTDLTFRAELDNTRIHQPIYLSSIFTIFYIFLFILCCYLLPTLWLAV